MKMAKYIIQGIKPLFPWSLLSALCLIVALIVGFWSGFPSIVYRSFFGGAIAFGILGTLLATITLYRRAPRKSPAYVTWGAFATIHIGTFCVTVTALFWIIFELGKISGKLG